MPSYNNRASIAEYRDSFVAEAKKRLVVSVLFGIGILLVLIPVLGGLVVVGYATITSTYATFSDMHKKSVLLTIIEKAHIYYTRYRVYPETIEELISRENFPQNVASELVNPKTKGQYIYRSTLNGANCVVITVLSDKSVFQKSCQETN